MFLRFNTFILLFALLFLTTVSSVFAQETANKKEKSDKKTATPTASFNKEAATAEQVAESAILIYGGSSRRLLCIRASSHGIFLH